MVFEKQKILKDEFYLKLGNKIKELRLKNNISQRELADELGLEFQNIQKFEKGKNRTSLFVLCGMCKVFNVDIEYFMS